MSVQKIKIEGKKHPVVCVSADGTRIVTPSGVCVLVPLCDDRGRPLKDGKAKLPPGEDLLEIRCRAYPLIYPGKGDSFEAENRKEYVRRFHAARKMTLAEYREKRPGLSTREARIRFESERSEALEPYAQDNLLPFLVEHRFHCPFQKAIELVQGIRYEARYKRDRVWCEAIDFPAAPTGDEEATLSRWRARQAPQPADANEGKRTTFKRGHREVYFDGSAKPIDRFQSKRMQKLLKILDAKREKKDPYIAWVKLIELVGYKSQYAESCPREVFKHKKHPRTYETIIEEETRAGKQRDGSKFPLLYVRLR